MAIALNLDRVKHGFGVTLGLPYQEAVERTKEALKAEGFGILTEIDVRQTVREKLDADFQPYVILGACNPPLAYAALQADPEVGLLLPCNVVVYERDGGSRVLVLDPVIYAGPEANDVVRAVADQAKHHLERAVQRLA